MIVYIAEATMNYEFSEVVGVFDNKDDARSRCLAANEGSFKYFDYCTIETWELGAMTKLEDEDEHIQLREPAT